VIPTESDDSRRHPEESAGTNDDSIVSAACIACDAPLTIVRDWGPCDCRDADGNPVSALLIEMAYKECYGAEKGISCVMNANAFTKSIVFTCQVCLPDSGIA